MRKSTVLACIVVPTLVVLLTACGGRAIAAFCNDPDGCPDLGGAPGDASSTFDAGVGCPAAPPKSGAPCDPATSACAYPNACGGSDSATCSGTRWALVVGACPVPAGCPTAEPRAGTSCTRALKCPYSTACGAVDASTCNPSPSGVTTWAIAAGTCPSPCPSAPPRQGAACAREALDCKYQNGCGGVNEAYCKGGTWATMTGTCTAGCEAQMPTSGTACQKPSATACVYVAQNDPRCTSSCYCATDVRWACLPATCTQ